MADVIQGLPPMPGVENQAPAPGYTVGTTAEAPAGNVQPEQPPGMFGGMGPMLIIYVAIFAGMWFLIIRPQRRREKQMKELQSSISAGDNIITSGGLFGKIADVGEDCFIVEFGTNRGVRIPVLKGDVVGVREPKMTPQVKEEG